MQVCEETEAVGVVEVECSVWPLSKNTIAVTWQHNTFQSQNRFIICSLSSLRSDSYWGYSPPALPLIISGSGPRDQIREKYTMHFRSTEASHRCAGCTIHHFTSANPNLNHSVSGWGCIFPFFAFSTLTPAWAGRPVFNGNRSFLSRVLRLPVESAADKHDKHALFA